jgi:hypothetical protein
MYQTAKSIAAPPRKLTKREQYEELIRDNFFAPSIKCPLVTLPWIKAVRMEQYWCTMTPSIRLMNCAAPPKKHVIVSELLRECGALGLKTGIDFHNAPDIPWLLAVLSTVNQYHPFFARDYAPEQVPMFESFEHQREQNI